MWKDFEEAGQFERTCIEGRGNLKGLQPLTSQPCGSVSCEGNCAGCMEIDQYSVDMRDKSP